MAASFGSTRLYESYVTWMEYDLDIFGLTIVTTVTACPFAVATWIGDVLNRHNTSSRRIVGLDALSSPTFNRFSTLQLCVGRHCLIYQIFQTAVPSLLVNFLTDHYNNVFVGVGISWKVQKLMNDYGIGGNACSMELGSLAALRHNQMQLLPATLKALAMLILKVDLKKPEVPMNSMWHDVNLTQDQVVYASIDPLVSAEIGTIQRAGF